mmetsp:Transcript_61492/g.139195  ORF Transcript_61492/g.139195 Transcript_61492/m.139195 type:complete len:193 (-) Transcript_61492:322-900(-)
MEKSLRRVIVLKWRFALLAMFPCLSAQQPDQRSDCKQLIVAEDGCRNYEVLAACPASCIAWLSSADARSLNPDAQPHGPLRAPPGGVLFESLIALSTRETSDNDEQCASWARRGECEKNGPYMNGNCVKSCTQRTAIAVAMRPPDEVVDLHEECAGWAADGECSKNPISMLTWCPHTCLEVAQSEIKSRSEL